MSEFNVLGLSGSLRAASFNTMLVKQALAAFGDAQTTVGDLNLPLYSGDLEQEGLPASVKKLGEQIANADAVIISSPEYNKAISGVLKNALDWISRVPDGVLRGKPTLVVAAAAGRAGGETAHYMTRHCLAPLGADVMLTAPVLVAGAFNAFDDEGKLKDEDTAKVLAEAVAGLKRAVQAAG